MNKSKWFGVALILYLCIVVWVVLLSRQPSEKAIVKFHSETILYFLGYYPDWQSDVTALHPEAMFIEDILNIILFMPIGLLSEAILITKKRESSLLWCTIGGFVCSLAIEITQLVTRRGWFDVDDLLMNTIGSILGGTLYLLLKRILKNKYSEPEK